MTENTLPVCTAVWFTALKAVFCEWPLQLQHGDCSNDSVKNSQ